MIDGVDADKMLGKNLFPQTFANDFRCVPLRMEKNTLVLGAYEELTPTQIERIIFFSGLDLRFEHISAAQWHVSYRQHYESIGSPAISENASIFQVTHKDEKVDLEQNGSVNHDIIEKVNRIISDAIHVGASDIHFESFETSFRIRYRIDGALQEAGNLPMQQRAAIISRLKIMADLDIAEKRRPQDGRITVSNGKQSVDIRVSTLPTSFGEKIVLRLLDKSAKNFALSSLGLSEQSLEILRGKILLPNGILLVTGPTGSGKSTTLYAILRELNDSKRNIVTIEDPIEYDIAGINQAHAKPEIGFSFAQALRTFLRQDPDIIMVGEIRDSETAEMAVRSALTGHLVLSTLHTNDAPGAVVRLIDMGIESYLLAAALRVVVAQRLVRVLCPVCKKSTSATLLSSHLKIPIVTDTWFEPIGCEACRFTGFRGRTAIFQTFCIDEQTANLIEDSVTADKLRQHARENGLQYLRELGLRLVEAGTTSLSEVMRETMS